MAVEARFTVRQAYQRLGACALHLAAKRLGTKQSRHFGLLTFLYFLRETSGYAKQPSGFRASSGRRAGGTFRLGANGPRPASRKLDRDQIAPLSGVFKH